MLPRENEEEGDIALVVCINVNFKVSTQGSPPPFLNAHQPYGLFTLPDMDSDMDLDLDSKSDGYIVLHKTVPIT